MGRYTKYVKKEIAFGDDSRLVADSLDRYISSFGDSAEIPRNIGELLLLYDGEDSRSERHCIFAFDSLYLNFSIDRGSQNVRLTISHPTRVNLKGNGALLKEITGLDSILSMAEYEEIK